MKLIEIQSKRFSVNLKFKFERDNFHFNSRLKAMFPFFVNESNFEATVYKGISDNALISL